MGRYLGPKRRLSRREGLPLYGSKKYSFDLRPFAPGQHGAGRRTKLSDYGLQLREKQKVKRLYGILEKQFRSYYEKASQRPGVTGTVLLQMLEKRLDNVIFRLGLAKTRAQGRQIVSHGMVSVNGRRVNIPSYQFSVGDVLELKPKKDTAKKYLEENLEFHKDHPLPAWLAFDAKALTAKAVGEPTREDVQFPIQEQMIIELYSK
ncbi:MAG: 30S ribosomal protein S4 [Candidatus Omnitrophica bacterium CG12_big_fil_rev_8_21_14_0_65_50_5]|nr:MAG: 30S ribosomal protein S4 [Candidatus Omnitrophica bacterium CG12_big_fil_rev_8_21_14_0_65_50_5]